MQESIPWDGSLDQVAIEGDLKIDYGFTWRDNESSRVAVWSFWAGGSGKARLTMTSLLAGICAWGWP